MLKISKKIYCKRCNEVFFTKAPRCFYCSPCRKPAKREWDSEYKRTHRKEATDNTRKLRLNPEYRKKQLIWNEKWRKNNLEKVRFIKLKSQYKRQNRLGKADYSFEDWKNLKKKHNYECLGCNRKEPEIKLTVDHIIPISKGGKNSLDNIQPLCGSCNSRKNNNTKWNSITAIYAERKLKEKKN